jgi:hypothetical protein
VSIATDILEGRRRRVVELITEAVESRTNFQQRADEQEAFGNRLTKELAELDGALVTLAGQA